MADDVHPEDRPHDTDEERTDDAVLHAAETDALVRQPAHDPTTQREAVENALQDEGVSEAGGVVGDDT
jgi:hypothetical protein